MSLKTIIVILSIFVISACTSNHNNSESDYSSLVKENAERALQSCGKGNVKQVDIDGFECKNG